MQNGHIIQIFGGQLTSDELQILRQSVFYSIPLSSFVMCRTPRHAFVFYDVTGKYLGYLKVCFECGCAELSNEAAPKPGWNYLLWDRAALRRIVTDHNLTVHSAVE
jgi:hypothetical protein